MWCTNLQRKREENNIYGPFYRIGPKSELEKICMYANCIIFKVHISSNCAVNSHIVFSESFGIFVLSPNLSLPKHSNNNLIRMFIDLLRFSLHLHCKYLVFCYFVFQR